MSSAPASLSSPMLESPVGGGLGGACVAARKQARRGSLEGGSTSGEEEHETKRPKLAHLQAPPCAAAPSAPSADAADKPPAKTDFRSVLRQAAMERAARGRTLSNSSGAGDESPSSTSTHHQDAATKPPSPAAASLPPDGGARKAPSRLHLQIGSPSGSTDFSRIGTPVLYTGPSGSPRTAQGSGSASPSDELAGFERYQGLPTYVTPPSLPASAPASGSAAATKRSSPTAEDGIPCPLCAQSFPANFIERHASSCTGEPCDEVRISSMPDSDRERPSPAAATPRPAAAAASTAPVSFATRCTPPTKPLSFFPRHHDTLKVLTWNCWFDDFCMRQRMDAIGSVIIKEAPHIVALQEITADSLTMIQRSEWIKKYYVTERSEAPYFTLLCTKFAPIHPRRLPFQSEMARDLVCMNIEVSTTLGARHLSIATSHLESEHRRKAARRQQLEVALKLLRQSKQQTATALYCGDMNLVGPEASDIVSKYGWVDSWAHLNPQRGGEKAGITMDTKLNGMLAAQPRNAKGAYQVRLDRVFMRFGSGEKRVAGEGADATKASTSAAAAASDAKTPSNSPSATTALAPVATSGEWRLVSLERVGLCAIDLRQAGQYASKNYRQFEAPTTSAANTPTDAAAASNHAAMPPPYTPSPRIHGFGSAATVPASPSGGGGPVVFPSDHFGLLLSISCQS